MARWLIQASALFTPLINLLEDAFFDHDIALSDDTGIRVLKEDGRRASTQSALWIRRGGAPETLVVLVDYRVFKSSETVYRLLSQFSGYLVTDGAASIARTALDWYGKLYRIEREAKHLRDEQRHATRQSQAVPVWTEFLRWATRVFTEGVTHGKTTEALAYLLKHQDGLQGDCQDGRLPISNIRSEHVAKTIAITRQNLMFADTPSGADASARIFSVIETARANGHHPYKYLSVVLTRLPQVSCVEDVEQLLPGHLSPDRAAEIFATYSTPSTSPGASLCQVDRLRLYRAAAGYLQPESVHR